MNTFRTNLDKKIKAIPSKKKEIKAGVRCKDCGAEFKPYIPTWAAEMEARGVKFKATICICKKECN